MISPNVLADTSQKDRNDLMAEKSIDLTRTLFDLTEEYPELIDIFYQIGLEGVIHPEMRRTGGKNIRVIEGFKHHNISPEEAVKTLAEKGFKASY